MKILITGASGFVGINACHYFKSIGHEIIAFSRSNINLPQDIKLIKNKSLSGSLLPKNLKGIECVIHCAGKPYSIKNKIVNSNQENSEDIVKETLDLAKNCAKASVKRFIFVSSIKVNGENTEGRGPFNENDIPNPNDNYALSKYKSELGLFKIAKKTTLEIVIIRPPLIYGRGVKGYFRYLLKIIKIQLPLPLGSILNNRRSYIYIDNFLNLLSFLIKHPQAKNNIFVCRDGDEISTTNLLKNLYFGMNKKSFIFKVPRSIIKIFFYCIGKRNFYEKLYNSLSIDLSKCKKLLGWEPPIKIKDALKRVAHDYLYN